MNLEKLVYLAFASRNRLLQSGEITQLVSSVVGWKAEVVIHIDRISMSQSRHSSSSCHPHALLCQPASYTRARPLPAASLSWPPTATSSSKNTASSATATACSSPDALACPC